MAARTHTGPSAAAARANRFATLDEAAYGAIYGAVTVLTLLIAFEAHASGPIHMAVTLLGSVTAILLSKAFAEVMSKAIQTGRRPDREALVAAWHHVRPALVAANLPAALFVLVHFGVGSGDSAVKLSQIYCVFLLSVFGARLGWIVDRTIWSASVSALFACGFGLVLSVAKFLLHG